MNVATQTGHSTLSGLGKLFERLNSREPDPLFMPIVVSNRISVAKGWAEEFERRWKARKWLIAQSPGFVRTEVLRPVKGESYVVMTYWRSKEDFESWTKSPAFMESHSDTPPKEAFDGPSRLEIHEVIAEKIAD